MANSRGVSSEVLRSKRSAAGPNGHRFWLRGRKAMVQLLVNVDVDDLEKAIEFYRSALGLTLKRRLFNDTVAEMIGASSPIYLLKKPAGSTASATLTTLRDYSRHWTPVH